MLCIGFASQKRPKTGAKSWGEIHYPVQIRICVGKYPKITHSCPISYFVLICNKGAFHWWHPQVVMQIPIY